MATTLAPPVPAAPDNVAPTPPIAPIAIHVPLFAWVVFAVALLWVTYAFVGQNVLPDVWDHMHEFFHDGRHFLGIACH